MRFSFRSKTAAKFMVRNLSHLGLSDRETVVFDNDGKQWHYGWHTDDPESAGSNRRFKRVLLPLEGQTYVPQFTGKLPVDVDMTPDEKTGIPIGIKPNKGVIKSRGTNQIDAPGQVGTGTPMTDMFFCTKKGKERIQKRRDDLLTALRYRLVAKIPSWKEGESGSLTDLETGGQTRNLDATSSRLNDQLRKANYDLVRSRAIEDMPLSNLTNTAQVNPGHIVTIRYNYPGSSTSHPMINQDVQHYILDHHSPEIEAAYPGIQRLGSDDPHSRDVLNSIHGKPVGFAFNTRINDGLPIDETTTTKRFDDKPVHAQIMKIETPELSLFDFPKYDG